MRDGERWDGEFEAAAREARLIRQRNLALGWHEWTAGRTGWRDPQKLLRQLEGQRQDYLTLYERAHDAQDAQAEYFDAYLQAVLDAALHGLHIKAIRHARGAP